MRKSQWKIICPQFSLEKLKAARDGFKKAAREKFGYSSKFLFF